VTDSLKSQAVKGVVWSAVERFSVQGIQFVLSIIIARLVAPSEYGLIAMLGIFLAIAQTFIDSGFSNALIQKKDRTEVDFSTVFYFNIVVSIFVYTLLFLASPYIAVFYKEPQLEIITKWIGLGLVISGFSIVQRAKLTISLNFKTGSSFVNCSYYKWNNWSCYGLLKIWSLGFGCSSFDK
jgi:teichuronic acid exporter